MSQVKFIRALGIRAKSPGVVVTVGNRFVKWGPKRDWTCDCLTDADEYECKHIEIVRDLLDPCVLGDDN